MKTDDKGRDLPATMKKVKFIPPSYALKAKAPLREIDLDEAVMRANARLEDLQGEYLSVLEEECNILYAACAEVEKTGGGEAAVALLNRMAHEIRGHSGSIGFNAVCRVCDSLCSFLTKRRTLPPRGIEIARLHVEAMVVVLQNIDDWQLDGRFNSLFRDLNKVIRKFLANEQRERSSPVAGQPEARDEGAASSGTAPPRRHRVSR